jgi:hypothetical protein
MKGEDSWAIGQEFAIADLVQMRNENENPFIGLKPFVKQNHRSLSQNALGGKIQRE